MTGRPRVLLVDDEPMVLEGLSLRLRRLAVTECATSGEEALGLMRTREPFDVVVSDMRMPRMDGAAFLAAAAEVSPDTVRILLTGQADVAAAIAAINDGGIFRFLTKPCPPETLTGALEAAFAQRRLLGLERTLLRDTLAGSIRALTQVAAALRPEAVGRSERIRRRIAELAAAAGEESWQAETAAMFLQMGALFLPADVEERRRSGAPLTERDERLVEGVPHRAAGLLADIPRLDEVRDILRAVACPGPADPWGARALRAVVELDAMEERGVPAPQAVAVLRHPAGRHDPEILGRLAPLAFAARPAAPAPGHEAHGDPTGEAGIRLVTIHDLRPGMVLAADLVDSLGRKLLGRGIEITAGLERRIAEIADLEGADRLGAIAVAVGSCARQGAVAGAVGHHRPDAVATTIRTERGGAGREPDAGDASSVRVEVGVGDAGVAIDRRV